jgi:hypothetical protein
MEEGCRMESSERTFINNPMPHCIFVCSHDGYSRSMTESFHITEEITFSKMDAVIFRNLLCDLVPSLSSTAFNPLGLNVG